MIVKEILIGPQAGAPLLTVESVFAEAGKGLAGDRYHAGRGAFNAPQFDQTVREVTLIGTESIRECNARLETALSAADFRRNLVTEGLDLRALKGKRFRIGEAVLRHVRSAPPCRYLARLSGADMMTGLKGIGGIRAVIEHSGTIRTGDAIHVLS